MRKRVRAGNVQRFIAARSIGDRRGKYLGVPVVTDRDKG